MRCGPTGPQQRGPQHDLLPVRDRPRSVVELNEDEPREVVRLPDGVTGLLAVDERAVYVDGVIGAWRGLTGPAVPWPSRWTPVRPWRSRWQVEVPCGPCIPWLTRPGR
jgi:hypothetical protein